MAAPKLLYVSEETPHGPHTLDIFLSGEEAVEYGLIDRIMRAGEGVVKANKGI